MGRNEDTDTLRERWLAESDTRGVHFSRLKDVQYFLGKDRFDIHARRDPRIFNFNIKKKNLGEAGSFIFICGKSGERIVLSKFYTIPSQIVSKVCEFGKMFGEGKEAYAEVRIPLETDELRGKETIPIRHYKGWNYISSIRQIREHKHQNQVNRSQASAIGPDFRYDKVYGKPRKGATFLERYIRDTQKALELKQYMDTDAKFVEPSWAQMRNLTPKHIIYEL